MRIKSYGTVCQNVYVIFTGVVGKCTTHESIVWRTGYRPGGIRIRGRPQARISHRGTVKGSSTKK